MAGASSPAADMVPRGAPEALEATYNLRFTQTAHFNGGAEMAASDSEKRTVNRKERMKLEKVDMTYRPVDERVKDFEGAVVCRGG
jgi:hypothetical protein